MNGKRTIESMEAIFLELPEERWSFRETYRDSCPYVVVSDDGHIVGYFEHESSAEFLCLMKNCWQDIGRFAEDAQKTIDSLKEENGRLRLALNILRSEVEDSPTPVSQKFLSWIRRRLGRATTQG
jgi:hypothetical protein